jgi:hypothetical protein
VELTGSSPAIPTENSYYFDEIRARSPGGTRHPAGEYRHNASNCYFMRLVGPTESYSFQYSANGLKQNECLEVPNFGEHHIFCDVTPCLLADRVHIS